MNPHFGLTNTPRISASIVCLIIEHTFFKGNTVGKVIQKNKRGVVIKC